MVKEDKRKGSGRGGELVKETKSGENEEELCGSV
jgi:hypothetical protein